MAEESNIFSSEESASADQTQIAHVRAEKQAEADVSPIDVGAQIPLADQATALLVPMQNAHAQETLPGVPSGTQAAPPYNFAYTPQYAQPGYPPNIYQQPPPGSLPLQPGQPGLFVPPRKRYTWLWALLIVVVIFLLSSGVALAIVANLGPSNTPTQALQQYCDGYMTANAQEVYDTLSTPSKARSSLTDIQQSVDQLKNLNGLAKLTDCKVSDVQQNSSGATGTITLTEKVAFGDLSVSVPISMGLVLENNTWKIDIFQTHSNFPFPTPTVPSDVSPQMTSQQ